MDDFSAFGALEGDNGISPAMFFHDKDVLFHDITKKHPAAKAQNAWRQRRRQENLGSKHFTKEIQRGMTATGEHFDY